MEEMHHYSDYSAEDWLNIILFLIKKQQEFGLEKTDILLELSSIDVQKHNFKFFGNVTVESNCCELAGHVFEPIGFEQWGVAEDIDGNEFPVGEDIYQIPESFTYKGKIWNLLIAEENPTTYPKAWFFCLDNDLFKIAKYGHRIFPDCYGFQYLVNIKMKKEYPKSLSA